MKKLILIVLFFLLFQITKVYTQPNWFWQNPLPQGNTLHSVKFINTFTGIAVGESGIILRTTNKGLDWNVVLKSTDRILHFVSILDSTSLITVGSSGVILKSTNSGLNWFSLFSGITNDLYTSIFLNSLTGYAAGYEIVLKTTDGGYNWFQPSSSISHRVFGLHFINANTGWITGRYFIWPLHYYHILKTTNSGVNWLVQNSWLESSEGFPTIFFMNENTGWCSPNFKTTNSGVNWFTETITGSSVYFVNDTHGWKVSDTPGTIYRTTNSGINWLPIYCSIENIPDIHFVDSLFGCGVADFGQTIMSSNGGNSWMTISEGFYNNIKRLSAVDSNYLWAACSVGIILRSTNSGLNWSEHYVGSSSEINDLYFVNHSTGFAVNWEGNVLKSSNGGINWFVIDSSGYIPRSVYFINQYTGWVGDLSSISKTTNGGINWVHTGISGISWINGICFINENTGWLTGYHIVKTTNGGNYWITQLVSGGYFFEEPFFINENTGWVLKPSGDPTYLYKTTNGGNNWTEIFYFNSLLFDIYFADSLKGMVVGRNRFYQGTDKILITSNGGYNWYYLPAVSTEHGWSCMEFVSSEKGWIGGNGGAILKTTNFGGAPLSIQSDPKIKRLEYFLHHNYPNPFNPITSIKFDLPKNGFVTLKVFDILGREITTLVEGNIKAGTHHVNWDGHDYPSGVYFYRMVAGDFANTKKMLLLK